MLDARIRPIIDERMRRVATLFVRSGATANQITMVGFLFGLSAMLSIALGDFVAGLLLFLVNRFCDGLDGAVARQNGQTDFGGFLDIVCDFVIYSGIVFAFAIYNPVNALPAAFLIFCFVGPISSFLAYAIIAAKRGMTTSIRGSKSFYYLGGICEGTETTATLLLMCILPELFLPICLVYGVLCILTTIGRSATAYKDFSG